MHVMTTNISDVVRTFHGKVKTLDTGWDTKIRNLLFGLFGFEQVSEICSNVPDYLCLKYAVNKYPELGQSKQSKQKVPDFGYPTQSREPMMYASHTHALNFSSKH